MTQYKSTEKTVGGQKLADHIDELIERNRGLYSMPGKFENGNYIPSDKLSPTKIANELASFADRYPNDYAEAYEILNEKYKFKKGTNAEKLYQRFKSGENPFESRKAKQSFDDDNINTYNKTINAGNRMFLKFKTRPKPQVIYALKSRGWHWNATEGAWSIQPDKYDEEYIKNFSETYAKYL